MGSQSTSALLESDSVDIPTLDSFLYISLLNLTRTATLNDSD